MRFILLFTLLGVAVTNAAAALDGVEQPPVDSSWEQERKVSELYTSVVIIGLCNDAYVIGSLSTKNLPFLYMQLPTILMPRFRPFHMLIFHFYRCNDFTAWVE